MRRAIALVVVVAAASCGGASLDPGPKGGTSGAAGTTVSTGVAGAGGIGGTGECTTHGGTGTGARPAPSCGSALCGNGVRDTCTVLLDDGYGTCIQPRPITETCDGADLGPSTCANVGFGSGTVACGANCQVDTAGCSDCVVLDANVVRCGDAPVNALPSALALAATNDEIGLAWVEVRNLDRRLFFARLSPGLELLSSTPIDAPAGGTAANSVPNIAVAPLPSGWVLAWFVEGQVFLQAISATGADLGRTTLTAAAGLSSGYPILVARPNGAPLIAWDTPGPRDDGILHVAVVGSDGKSVSAPRELTIELRNRGFSIALIGDAFYVTTSADTATAFPQLRLKRIEADGTPTTVVDALPGIPIVKADLVQGAGDLQIIYGGIIPGGVIRTSGYLLQKLDPSGLAVGAPVEVGGGTLHGRAAVIPIAIGTETVALFGVAGGNGIGFERVGAGGVVVSPQRTIAQWPPVSDYQVAAVGRGPDLVVAWGPSLSGGLRMARVVP